jgi:peptide/nickel transport system ATP-binding protein
MDRRSETILSLDKRLVVRAGVRQVIVEPEAEFAVRRGDLVFLSGATGAGKTLLGRRLADTEASWWQKNRGERPRVGTIFQEPSAFSDPYTSARRQLEETAKTYGSREDIDSLCRDLGISAREGELFPGGLSAGQQQRLLIGIQLLRRPELLIADEPTSALDPVNRAKIIRLLVVALYRRHIDSLLLITHDQLVVHLARMIWRELGGEDFPGLFFWLEFATEESGVTCLRSAEGAGTATETGGSRPLWLPCSQYVGFLSGDARIRRRASLEQSASVLAKEMEGRGASCLRELEEGSATPVLLRTERGNEGMALDRWFFYGRPRCSAGIDFSREPVCIEKGQIAALIGESGAGKTTAMRVAARLLSGHRGRGWEGVKERLDDLRWRTAQRNLQIVFQNPEATTLNPSQTIGRLVASLPGGARAAKEECGCLLRERLQLPGDVFSRYPSELSGGEKYRCGLLLALVNEPDFLILDEPFAAVDEEIQMQIVELCFELKRGTLGGKGYRYRSGDPLGVLIISHQVEIVFKICDWWYLIDRRGGREFGECVWGGRPVDAYGAFRRGEIRSPYLDALMALVFENRLPAT